ncbi:hypothetical protein GCM10007350_31770 [Jeongeupia chitinilytica]|uniref:Uncharacterized protein n=1 Tax=Jeongeupia chitinilytica TaxID=1041641 RepID=A0ABQ3H481_9NEIS|nr:hypothetical protein GCM10007350_31770 [Jeongeupia chitinilytica]
MRLFPDSGTAASQACDADAEKGPKPLFDFAHDDARQRRASEPKQPVFTRSAETGVDVKSMRISSIGWTRDAQAQPPGISSGSGPA